jgi:hypothetical protein
MTERNGTVLEAPSKVRILQATIVAMLVAMVVLFTAILPAEYGFDPLGTGAALGLTDLAEAGADSAAGAPVLTNSFIAQPSGYKVDSREIPLESGQGIEIKYHMEAGAGMVYSWTVTPKELLFYELHAEPDEKPAGAPEDYYLSYEKDDQVGKSESYGTFIAPSTGIHGWFWENQTGVPVTIKLVTAGFYDYIVRYDGGIRLPPLMPADPR